MPFGISDAAQGLGMYQALCTRRRATERTGARAGLGMSLCALKFKSADCSHTGGAAVGHRQTWCQRQNRELPLIERPAAVAGAIGYTGGCLGLRCVFDVQCGTLLAKAAQT